MESSPIPAFRTSRPRGAVFRPKWADSGDFTSISAAAGALPPLCSRFANKVGIGTTDGHQTDPHHGRRNRLNRPRRKTLAGIISPRGRNDAPATHLHAVRRHGVSSRARSAQAIAVSATCAATGTMRSRRNAASRAAFASSILVIGFLNGLSRPSVTIGTFCRLAGVNVHLEVDGSKYWLVQFLQGGGAGLENGGVGFDVFARP